MHTYTAPNGLRVHYNYDGSGMAHIVFEDKRIDVPGADIVPLIEEYSRLEAFERVFAHFVAAEIVAGNDGQPVFHGVDGEWVEAAKGIMAKITDPEHAYTRISVGGGETERGCRFCESVDYSYHNAAPSEYVEIDGIRHDLDCVYVTAVRLKEGH
jgi:hypothetical protein